MSCVIRTETLTFSGTISAEQAQSFTLAPPDEADPDHIYPAGGSSGNASCAIGGISWTSDYYDDKVAGVNTHHAGWIVSCGDAGGGSATGSHYTSTTIPGTNPPVTAALSSTGSWTITAVCELVIDHSGITTPSMAADPPHGYGAVVYWRTKAGSTAVSSVTLGGASASSSTTIVAASPLSIKNLGTESCTVFARGLGGYSRSASMVMSWLGNSSSRSVSFTHAIGSASSGGATVALTATSDATPGNTSTASGDLTVAPPKAYELDTRIRAMSAAYPVDVSLDWSKALGLTDAVTASGGSWSGSYTQRCETGHISLSGASASYSDSFSYDDFSPIALTIKSAWATARKELTSDLGVLFKDRYMAGISLVNADADLEAGTDSTTSTSLTRTWSTPQKLMGGRYLQITARKSGSGSTPFTVALGGKTWNRDKDGTALAVTSSDADFVLDLLLPASATADSDGTDTFYPLSALSGGTRTEGGDYSGICSASSLTLSASSATAFVLGDVTLLASVDATAYALSAKTWNTLAPDSIVSSHVTTAHFGRPWLELTTDGRLLSIEQTDCRLDHTTSDESPLDTYSLTDYSMQWLHDHLSDDVSAWSVTLDAPAVGAAGTLAEYYNVERECWGLLGGGAMWVPGSPGAWAFLFDVAPSELGWQGGFTSFDMTGGAGDIFEFGMGALPAGVTPLKMAKVLGNQGEGLSLDEAGAAVASDTLRLTQASTTRGEGTTDAIGLARTGLAFGRSDDGGITLAEVESLLDLAYGPLARKRLHGRYVKIESHPLGAICSDSARGWLHVGREKKIETFRLDSGSATYASPDYDIDGWVALWHDPRGGTLWGLAKVFGGFKLYRSGDGGRTAQEVASVTAKTIQGTGLSGRAQQALLYSDSSSDIWRRVVRHGSTLDAAEAAILGASQLTGSVLDLWHDERHAGVMLMLVRDGAGDKKTYKSQDGGLHWTLFIA